MPSRLTAVEASPTLARTLKRIGFFQTGDIDGHVDGHVYYVLPNAGHLVFLRDSDRGAPRRSLKSSLSSAAFNRRFCA
jgi:hypothetical protein